MENPPRQMMDGYCRRIDVGQISLGFQPANLVTFNIKNYMPSNLRDTRSIEKLSEILGSMWKNSARLV